MIEIIHVHRLAQLLALELTDSEHTWAYIPQKRHRGDTLHQIASIRRGDGLEFYVNRDQNSGWADKATRFSIGQSFHSAAWQTKAGQSMDPCQSRWVGRDFVKECLPSLNASVKKTPAIIGRAVRKLIPDAERFHALALAKVEQYDSSADACTKYAEAMGCKSNPNIGNSDPRRRIELADSVYGSSHAEIECSSIGITIKIDCMTIAQAKAVLHALKLKV